MEISATKYYQLRLRHSLRLRLILAVLSEGAVSLPIKKQNPQLA